jgi:hypothetical protein
MKRGTPTLEHLTTELKREPIPELDWERIETRILARIGDGHAARSGFGWPKTAVALAAAAVLLLFAGSRYFRWALPAPAAPPSAAVAAGHVDGDRLSLGEWIESGETPRVVDHPGRATWTLAPNSRARLVATGAYLTVLLDAGSVVAEVVPRATPESFAVEVQQTRIAVHGTIFQVELADARVRVAVRQGTVVVGSALERGHTKGFLLAAPTAGTFSLDGAKSGQIDGTEPEPAERVPSTSPRVSAARTTPTVTPSATGAPMLEPGQSDRSVEPTAPSASAPPPGLVTSDAAAEQVVGAVDKCFAAHTPPRGDMLISVTFDLSIRFGPSGRVTGLTFDPPLLPAVERCSREAAARLPPLPASGQGFSMRRRVSLSR